MLAVLAALARSGALDPSVAGAAVPELGIDADAPDRCGTIPPNGGMPQSTAT